MAKNNSANQGTNIQTPCDSSHVLKTMWVHCVILSPTNPMEIEGPQEQLIASPIFEIDSACPRTHHNILLTKKSDRTSHLRQEIVAEDSVKEIDDILQQKPVEASNQYAETVVLNSSEEDMRSPKQTRMAITSREPSSNDIDHSSTPVITRKIGTFMKKHFPKLEGITTIGSIKSKNTTTNLDSDVLRSSMSPSSPEGSGSDLLSLSPLEERIEEQRDICKPSKSPIKSKSGIFDYLLRHEISKPAFVNSASDLNADHDEASNKISSGFSDGSKSTDLDEKQALQGSGCQNLSDQVLAENEGEEDTHTEWHTRVRMGTIRYILGRRVLAKSLVLIVFPSDFCQINILL
jgi:hypothetical protein